MNCFFYLWHNLRHNYILLLEILPVKLRQELVNLFLDFVFLCRDSG